MNEENYIAYYDSEGKLHKEDGPAVDYFGVFKAWYKHGKLHRVGLPAVEYVEFDDEYWEEGVRIG
jgi:hypothetical protein